MTKQEFQLLLAHLLAPKMASPVQPPPGRMAQPGLGHGPDPRMPIGPPAMNPGNFMPTDLSDYGSLTGAIGPGAFGRTAQPGLERIGRVGLPTPRRRAVLSELTLLRGVGGERPLPKPRPVHAPVHAYQRKQYPIRQKMHPDYPPEY